MKRLFSILTVLFAWAMLHAEVVVLRSGDTVEGTIVFQNEEVVVIKTRGGTRYQYPMSDVKEILKGAQHTDNQPNTEIENSTETQRKKVSLAIELSGGGAYMPDAGLSGGGVSGNLLIGTHNLLNRSIFLGGGVGYTGAFLPAENAQKQSYSFLPVMLAVRAPMMQQKHAPMIGGEIGYGIALSKAYKGGLHAGFNIGYCYRISEQQRLYVAGSIRLQQAFADTKSTIVEDGETYEYQGFAGTCLLTYGVRIGIFL